jgi:Acetyltransferases
LNEHCDVLVADYSNTCHQAAIADLMQGYSGDLMGGGSALPREHCAKISKALETFGHAVTVLAFSKESSNLPLGIATSITSFSTFYLKPVLNLHDVYVVPAARKLGVGKALLEATTAVALRSGCCKLTLEVLTHNTPAKRLYEKFGFQPYQLAGEAGTAEFWEKSLAAL